MGRRKSGAEKLEYTAVIDAATFSNSYHAFWNSNTSMCEHFVRRLNLGGLKRFARPIVSLDTKRRAVIAEYAFSLFVTHVSCEPSKEPKKNSTELEDEAWRATVLRLRPYIGQGVELRRAFSDDERKEISGITRRLVNFFNDRKPLLLRPIFAGCGYVDASEGDLISERTIYEIKTVERPFRSNDIRQTITYAALNYLSRQYQIENVGLLNPRSGLYCSFNVDYVCGEISGRPSQELFATIIDAISSGEISR
jgi:hypothetical protein